MISIPVKADFITAVRVLKYLKHLQNTALWRLAEWVVSYWLTHRCSSYTLSSKRRAA